MPELPDPARAPSDTAQELPTFAKHFYKILGHA